MITDNSKLTQSYIEQLKDWFTQKQLSHEMCPGQKVKVHEITEALKSLSQDIEMQCFDEDTKQEAFSKVMELIEQNTTYSEQICGHLMDLS